MQTVSTDPQQVLSGFLLQDLRLEIDRTSRYWSVDIKEYTVPAYIPDKNRQIWGGLILSVRTCDGFCGIWTLFQRLSVHVTQMEH